MPATQIAYRLAGTLPGDIRDYEIDHVQPLAGYDLTVDSQVAEAFAVANHAWLRRGINQRKGAR